MFSCIIYHISGNNFDEANPIHKNDYYDYYDYFSTLNTVYFLILCQPKKGLQAYNWLIWAAYDCWWLSLLSALLTKKPESCHFTLYFNTSLSIQQHNLTENVYTEENHLTLFIWQPYVKRNKLWSKFNKKRRSSMPIETNCTAFDILWDRYWKSKLYIFALGHPYYYSVLKNVHKMESIFPLHVVR